MTNEAMSPLRRRMIEDMTIRNFGPKTQHDYIRSVKNLTMFLGRSPDTATNEWPGRPKQLSDSELVCLAVAQVLLGARSEHHWLRLCYARLGHLFPYLPEASRAITSG